MIPVSQQTCDKLNEHMLFPSDAVYTSCIISFLPMSSGATCVCALHTPQSCLSLWDRQSCSVSYYISFLCESLCAVCEHFFDCMLQETEVRRHTFACCKSRISRTNKSFPTIHTERCINVESFLLQGSFTKSRWVSVQVLSRPCHGGLKCLSRSHSQNLSGLLDKLGNIFKNLKELQLCFKAPSCSSGFFWVLSLKSQFTFSPSQQKICIILLWKVRTLHQFLSSVRGTPAVFPLKVLCVKIQSKKVTIYNCVWMKDSVFVVIFSFSHYDNFQLSNLLLPAKRKVTLGNRT